MSHEKEPAPNSSRSTVEQLRDAIDRGHTGDKVAAFDPSSAPLGSDDEAAGHPIPPEQIAQALSETQNPAPSNPTGHSLWSPHLSALAGYGIGALAGLLTGLLMWLAI